MKLHYLVKLNLSHQKEKNERGYIHPVLEKLNLEDLESHVIKNQWNFKIKVSKKLGSKHLQLHEDETQKKSAIKVKFNTSKMAWEKERCIVTMQVCAKVIFANQK